MTWRTLIHYVQVAEQTTKAVKGKGKKEQKGKGKMTTVADNAHADDEEVSTKMPAKTAAKKGGNRGAKSISGAGNIAEEEAFEDDEVGYVLYHRTKSDNVQLGRLSISGGHQATKGKNTGTKGPTQVTIVTQIAIDQQLTRYVDAIHTEPGMYRYKPVISGGLLSARSAMYMRVMDGWDKCRIEDWFEIGLGMGVSLCDHC